MEAEGGAEVRRLHIIYILSRKGCTEHPYLIRVHHLSKNGVRLLDIKRWLGELRGKEMPESFAWSYKRRYKTGYVWQDLLDDDLLTPISDNEYVLKGSEISSSTNNTDFPFHKKKVPTQKEQYSSLQESAKDNLENQKSYSTKTSSEIEDQYSSPTFGSETSTLTDHDSGQKYEPDKINYSDTANQELKSSTLRHFLDEENYKNKKAKKVNKIINDEKGISTKYVLSSDKPHLTKRRSSNIFRNLITCGVVETNDSAVVNITNKQSRPFLGQQNQWSNSANGGVKDSGNRRGQQRAPCSAYKPLYGPKCSQCGKTFKPEKLHAHMKSCKGMKALAKDHNPPISAASSNASQTLTKSRNEDSVSGYFLTH